MQGENPVKNEWQVIKARRRHRRIGLAEGFLIVAITFVVGSALIYYATGIGNPPSTKMMPLTRGDVIVLKVTEGSIPGRDWQYLVFDDRINPPVDWTSAPADIKPEAEIVLAEDLPPATYRVQIRHIPTARFLMDTKVTIEN